MWFLHRHLLAEVPGRVVQAWAVRAQDSVVCSIPAPFWHPQAMQAAATTLEQSSPANLDRKSACPPWVEPDRFPCRHRVVTKPGSEEQVAELASDVATIRAAA